MKDEKKSKPSPKELPQNLTFEEAMRRIVNTPKEAVENAIKQEKKQSRGNVRKTNGLNICLNKDASR